MSERKVLSKYYPADFDPSALTRRRRGPKQEGPKVQTVRLMAPFSMKCTTCGEYIYRGRKFNARKETPEERYLGVQIYRFYIKCTRCSGEIRFRTDPANQDYVCESGAHRNTDPWKRGAGDAASGVRPDETDEERLDRLEHEEEERNAMVELEAKTVDAKREMAVADALDEIRSRNARIARADRDGVEVLAVDAADEERERQDREDAEAARRAFAFARSQQALEEDVLMEEDGEEEEEDHKEVGKGLAATETKTTKTTTTTPESKTATTTTTTKTDMPPPPVPPSFKRQVKKKPDRAALLGIKKKS